MMVEIPAEFWASFGDEGKVKEIFNPDNPGERRALYQDGHQTYANWVTGTFVVWAADGTEKCYSDVRVNRDDLMRLFPPKDEA